MAALFPGCCGGCGLRWDINLPGQLVMLSYWPAEAAIAYTSYLPSLIEMEAEHAAEGIEEAVADYN